MFSLSLTPCPRALGAHVPLGCTCPSGTVSKGTQPLAVTREGRSGDAALLCMKGRLHLSVAQAVRCAESVQYSTYAVQSQCSIVRTLCRVACTKTQCSLYAVQCSLHTELSGRRRTEAGATDAQKQGPQKHCVCVCVRARARVCVLSFLAAAPPPRSPSL